jgi:hypothetical protein
MFLEVKGSQSIRLTSQPNGPPWPLAGQLYLLTLLFNRMASIFFVGENTFIVFHIIYVVVIHFVAYPCAFWIICNCEATVKSTESIDPM